ncbi:DNA repair helicase XPB [Paenibacillus koleovorans]|uniref:DNA repair helicase XPB n=1 Tax=Paenibacillus koleovorans TaxID=121608 RepID=UPI000FDA32BE|nr:DNA repair helicase XPB [Paenibacillus koleovorans]
MKYFPERPLLVQSDSTLLLETHHDDFEQLSEELGKFAELVKAPEHLHTYRLTPLSLWNAASSGLSADQILYVLRGNSKLEVPGQVQNHIRHYVARYGLVRMIARSDGTMALESDDPAVVSELAHFTTTRAFFIGQSNELTIEFDPAYRGVIKQELIKLGYPVSDLAGYHDGERLPMRLKEFTGKAPAAPMPGGAFRLRDYQREAVDALCADGRRHGGSGVVVLPCGAGKTVVGIAAMARLQCATLILTTNVASVRQWKREIEAKTDLPKDAVGEYSGASKEVCPVTIATYQILTHRHRKDEPFSHMRLFTERDWGLIVYDEVHLLPAPVFRVTAEIQATRRLGLTATLVREDGCEEDVFSLVGPKLYEAGWKELEREGWIAKVRCTELRVTMPREVREAYMTAENKAKARIAGENPNKLNVIRQLMTRHDREPTLVIGQYLDQLKHISEELEAPMISGEMPHKERDRLYAQFREGAIRTLVVSKVANFAIDLPDARVAIQVSGSFGSRQEEAQRLGRILRPKADNEAFFYSLVSEESREQEFSIHRQLFLVEQGYRYEIRQAAAGTGTGTGASAGESFEQQGQGAAAE